MRFLIVIVIKHKLKLCELPESLLRTHARHYVPHSLGGLSAELCQLIKFQ